MQLRAVLIGSIGVLAETSDIQRRAYNRALEEAGVPWQWDVATYRKLLEQPGGRARLARIAAGTGTTLSNADIERIHAHKTKLACNEIVSRRVGLRPGVAALIDSALERNLEIALVTTTYRSNIDAIAKAAGTALPLERFPVVLTVDDCKETKPAPEIYEVALERLGVAAGQALAIEDSAASVRSAKGAGVYTIAVPGEFTRGQDFSEADLILDSLQGFALSAVG